MISVWIALCVVFFHYFIFEPLFLNSLSRAPGPKLFALTKWRLAYEDWKGTRTRYIQKLHMKYGSVVRIGPEEVRCAMLPSSYFVSRLGILLGAI